MLKLDHRSIVTKQRSSSSTKTAKRIRCRVRATACNITGVELKNTDAGLSARTEPNRRNHQNTAG